MTARQCSCWHHVQRSARLCHVATTAAGRESRHYRGRAAQSCRCLLSHSTKLRAALPETKLVFATSTTPMMCNWTEDHKVVRMNTKALSIMTSHSIAVVDLYT